MTVGDLLRRASSRELGEWMAFDKIEHEDVGAVRTAAPSVETPPPSGQRTWIKLDDPEIFDKLKRAAGL